MRMTRLIYAIAISALLFPVTLNIPLPMAPSTWDTEIVDAGYDVGLGSSIALDGGNNIHISYYDANQGDLKYAFKPFGGLTWDVDTVDFGVLPSSPPLGLCTSIALDGGNNIHISYYDANQGDLKYAFKPFGGLTWDVDTVDSEGDAGHYSSIALDEFNIPHISYYHNHLGVGWLMYASKTDGTWEGKGPQGKRVPDYSSGDIGLYTSLALDGFNNPHISYYDAEYGNLRYARWVPEPFPAIWGGTWNLEFVDGTPADDVGRCSSIAVSEMASIHISYIDAQTYDLKYAYKSHPDLLTWDKDTVDQGVITHVLDAYDMSTSIALDEWNHPHISYHDSRNHYVKYATKIVATWNPDIVEGIPSYQNLNLHSSITLDEWNKPHVSYYTMLDTESNEGLKYARLVGDIPPVAAFTEDAHALPVCTPITFDPSDSSDSDGPIVLYEWDWDGDGVYDYSTTNPDVVSHIYTALGTYTVTLRVTDADGLTDTATDTKTIVPARTLTADVVSIESIGTSWNPSLSLGSDGTVHIAWDDTTPNGGSDLDRDIFYRSYEPVTGWTGTEVVSDESTSTSWRPSLGIGSDGTVHIAWEDWTNYDGSGDDYDIFYKNYTDARGFSTTEVVSTESTGNSFRPSLAVDSSGNVHIAWEDSTDYDGAGADVDVFYRWFEVGVGWSSVKVVSDQLSDDSGAASLAVDSSGNVHIVWQDLTDYSGAGTDADIFYRRFEVGVDWTTTEVVSDESTGDSWRPSLGVGSDGTVHVAWGDNTPNYADSGTDQDIFYRRRESVTGLWIGTEVVSIESTGDSYNPSLGTGSCGIVHVAWEDRTNYVGSGTDYDIFYKRYAARVQVATTTRTGTAYFESDAGTITDLEAVDPDDPTLPPGKPGGVDFPHGLFSFRIEGLEPGQTVTVFIEFPSSVPVGTQYWTCHTPEGWVDLTSLLGDDEDEDEFLTLTLTDGDLGDFEPEAGIIVDPGGPAFAQPLPTGPTIESCDSTGARKDTFDKSENVYVIGSGYLPSTTYDMYVVEDVTMWTDGMTIPSRASATAISGSSDGSGGIPPLLVWTHHLVPGKYDIVMDVDGDGVYDAGADALDDSDVQVTAGFFVTQYEDHWPYWILVVVCIIIIVPAMAAYWVYRVYRQRRPS